MKKLAAMLLCLSMLSAGALTAYAEEEPNTAPGEATIGTVVPDSHKITITVTGNADVTVNGKEGSEFEVERLSEPVIKIKAKDGEKITKVLLNGEDITDKLVDGKLTLDPIYEDKALDIQVETEALPVDSSQPDSSTPDSSAPDSSKPDSSSSKPDSTKPSDGSANNPVTGVIGTVSVGGFAALAALTMLKRKNKDEE
jgi:hypothetical protein